MRMPETSRRRKISERGSKRAKACLQTEPEGAYKKIAREWHWMKSAKWSAVSIRYGGSASKRYFSDVCTGLVDQFKSRGLLDVLCKIEKYGVPEKLLKVRLRCAKNFAVLLLQV